MERKDTWERTKACAGISADSDYGQDQSENQGRANKDKDAARRFLSADHNTSESRKIYRKSGRERVEAVFTGNCVVICG